MRRIKSQAGESNLGRRKGKCEGPETGKSWQVLGTGRRQHREGQIRIRWEKQYEVRLSTGLVSCSKEFGFILSMSRRYSRF